MVVAFMLSASLTGVLITAGSASAASSPGGLVLGWGGNYFGQVGNGTVSSSGCGCVPTPAPVSLPAGTTVTAVSASGVNDLALTSTGAVLAWGDNRYGEAGNGTVSISGCGCVSTPTAVSLPSGTTVTAVSAGFWTALALTSTGAVLAWGYNYSGQVGNGTVSKSGCDCVPTPTPVSLPAGTTVTSLSAGGPSDLALTSTGAVLAWGANDFGQMGNGTVSGSGCQCVPTPTPVSLPAGTTAMAVSTGGYGGLALASTGAVLAWGANYFGQMGNGTVSNYGCECDTVPTLVSLPAGAKATAVSAGPYGDLVLTYTGRVLAWGYNPNGEVGDGTTSTSGCECVPTPTYASLPVGVTVGAVAVTETTTLAISSTGGVLAWGDNYVGELGNGTVSSSGCDCVPTPTAVNLPAGTTVADVSGNGLALVGPTPPAGGPPSASEQGRSRNPSENPTTCPRGEPVDCGTGELSETYD
ncbi:MAG TPA: hypothetical protein VG184_08030, partial [Acidimicrobiales bacterium]|nr:hypothetical protein [Acidimicrobiales bacterium]